HARFSQETLRIGVAVDRPPRPLVPADVEGGQLREELEPTVRQVVVNPPGERPPVSILLVAVEEPGYDDAGHGAHTSVGVAAVPDVRGVGLLVGRAVVTVPIAVFVDGRRAVSGTDGD